jgi:hypothetical protein
MFRFTYPGINGIESVDVTTSVGITPATIYVVASPDSMPATTGTLVIGDGVNPDRIFPDCFCSRPRQEIAAGSAVCTLQLQDRRWRWKYGFPAFGDWNQEAGSGKLVPWSVRSPWQMAYALLTILGELVDVADQIDLPPGLASPDAPVGPADRVISAAGQYLGLGQNYAPTQCNPHTVWGGRPAAQCLADLAEAYGRLVVFDPIDNRVRLMRIGVGPGLPAGARLRFGSAVERDCIPTQVIARGSPTEYQLRLRLRAVGREWDRSWRPINQLSYTPLLPAGQKMRARVWGTGTYDLTKFYAITLNGVKFESIPGVDSSFADVSATIAGNVNASANPAIAGKVTAAVDGSALHLDGVEDGYEFELTTEGTDEPATPGAWTWQAACVRGPIRGPYPRQNAWLVEFPDPQPAGTVLTVTINGTPFAAAVPAVPPGLNGLATGVADLAEAVDSPAATAVGGGRKLVVTAVNPGVAIVVTATSSTGAAPVVTQVATAIAPGRGWERCPGPPFGVFARVETDSDEPGFGRLSYEEAKRLANETVFTCYQVVLEDPADPTNKSIPVPEFGAVLNQFLLLLQADSPEPIAPRPGEAEVIDARTLQPFAATTYNGYTVRRPNRAFGSVCKHILARDGLLWRGGSYLTHNTPPRSVLPVPFSIVDPEQQVVQFSQPIYRWLGSGGSRVDGAAVQVLYPTGFTTHPAEVVIEVGAMLLEPSTLSPKCFEVSAAVPGGFGPPLTRVFPDIRREVIGVYDARHKLIPNPAAGFRVLDQDGAVRGLAYAQGVAESFQAPVGQSIEYHGLISVRLSGLVRQIRWSLRKGEPGASTSVDVNCETSRVVLPYLARRKGEGLNQDAARAQQNLMTDFLARAAQARRNNAMGAAGLGGLFPGGGR